MSLGYKILGVALACVMMFFVGRCSVGKQEITTIERVDTVVVEKPMPYKVEVVRKVSVPVYVPTPADTVVENKESAEENARKDSTLVEVPVEVERREYKSEEYRAVVSGAKIGDLRPTLDEIEIYNRNTTIVVEPKVPLFRPYVSGFAGKSVFGVGAGVEIKGHHGIGADYMHCEGKNAWAVRYTYKF